MPDRDVKQATQWLLMHKQVPQAELIREVNSCLALAVDGGTTRVRQEMRLR